MRFQLAARWLFRLLNPPPRVEPWLPLEHLVTERLTEITLTTAARAEIDASPWGGGGALYLNDAPVEFWAATWSETDASSLDVVIGQPAGQTTWELLAIFYSLVLWGRAHRGHGLILLGDNLAALESALNLRGRGSLAKLGRELSWRRARDGWRYVAGHLPSERNTVADALSRLSVPGPDAKQLPRELAGATRRDAPDLSELWSV